MTTVPGTYFTIEQLEAALILDNVSGGEWTGTHRMNIIGRTYLTGKKQYEKALAWYLLSARESNEYAPVRIGTLYFHGNGVPNNYLCALKWYLKAPGLNKLDYSLNEIGELFENGFGVPLDKYKALDWYILLGDKAHMNILESQGYRQSAADKKKSFYQLKKETEVILDAEKKKLEAKQHKTQQEMKTLKQLNITYKLTGDGNDAWKDVPILLADDKQRDLKLVNSSITNNEDEILELKKQIQLLMLDKNNLQRQSKQSQQKTTKLELQIMEKDKEIILLRNDRQSLQRRNSTVQHQITRSGSIITSLQSENQEQRLQINGLEYQLKEKHRKINSMENENRTYRASSLTQIQNLETLNHEKNTLKQNRIQAGIEMERLKASNASLKQLLKSKEDTTISLNGENQNLSTTNQLITEMVDTQKEFLQAKTNEMELLRQNMERQLADEKKRVEVLEQEVRVLRQERAQDETNVQNTNRLDSSNPANVESSNGRDDGNAHNDINHDSEYDNTEVSDNDINYDTPSEDEDK